MEIWVASHVTDLLHQVFLGNFINAVGVIDILISEGKTILRYNSRSILI